MGRTKCDCGCAVFKLSTDVMYLGEVDAQGVIQCEKVEEIMSLIECDQCYKEYELKEFEGWDEIKEGK